MVVIVLVLLAIFLTLIAYDLWKKGRRVQAMCSAFVLIGLEMAIASVSVGVPNILGLVGEGVTVAMLRNHADEDSLQRWLQYSGADWHPGAESPCYKDCSYAMQAEFTKQWWICVVSGDRITMHFDDKRKLRSWSVQPAGSAC